MITPARHQPDTPPPWRGRLTLARSDDGDTFATEQPPMRGDTGHRDAGDHGDDVKRTIDGAADSLIVVLIVVAAGSLLLALVYPPLVLVLAAGALVFMFITYPHDASRDHRPHVKGRFGRRRGADASRREPRRPRRSQGRRHADR